MSVATKYAAGRVAAARQVRMSLGAVVKRWGKEANADEAVLVALARAVRCLYAIEVCERESQDALIDEAIRAVEKTRELVPATRTYQIEQVARRLSNGTPRPNNEPMSLAVEVSRDSESNFFTSVTGDISDGGVFVATDEPLPVGTPLRLFLRMPTGDLEARGDVAWVRTGAGPTHQGMGVRLHGTQLGDHEPIMRVVAEREPIAI